MRVNPSDCSVTLVVGSVVPNIIPVSAIISPPHDNHRPCYRHHLRHNHHHFQHHRQPSPLPEVLFSILVYYHFGSSQALLKQCLVPIENKGEMGMGRDSRERDLMAFSPQRPHGGRVVITFRFDGCFCLDGRSGGVFGAQREAELMLP